MKIKVNGSTLELLMGDITLAETYALVNAANSALAGGGGVDGAIHRAGGPEIKKECAGFKGCPTGSAVITTGGLLKALYVIHAVGPVYRGGVSNEADLLSGAYESSLRLAAQKGLESISFPSISTGAYAYPINEAARIALKTAVDFLKAEKSIKLVRFVLFSDSDLEAYSHALKEVAGRSG